MAGHNFELCLLADEMLAEVESVDGMELAANTCTHYHSTGPVLHPYASGGYLSELSPLSSVRILYILLPF